MTPSPEHSKQTFRVFIVDDDAAVRDALGLLLGLNDYPVLLFSSAESFLQSFKPDWTGCLLLDIRMPGMDGLALQKHLQSFQPTMPVIIMSAHGNVDSAREAFKAKAIDFLEKPIDETLLLNALNEAKKICMAQQANHVIQQEHSSLLASLTPREKEIMNEVVQGHHNRDIAERLGISPRTVEVHKARILAKLGVDNIPALVRLSLQTTNDSNDSNLT